MTGDRLEKGKGHAEPPRELNEVSDQGAVAPPAPRAVIANRGGFEERPPIVIDLNDMKGTLESLDSLKKVNYSLKQFVLHMKTDKLTQTQRAVYDWILKYKSSKSAQAKAMMFIPFALAKDDRIIIGWSKEGVPLSYGDTIFKITTDLYELKTYSIGNFDPIAVNVMRELRLAEDTKKPGVEAQKVEITHRDIPVLPRNRLVALIRKTRFSKPLPDAEGTDLVEAAEPVDVERIGPDAVKE